MLLCFRIMLKVTVYVHVDEAIVSEEVNELMSYTD